MKDEYNVLELEMRTLSTVISGEIKGSEREKKIREDRIHLPCRITGDGKVAIPIYGVIRGYIEKTLRAKGNKVCDTGERGAKGCGNCEVCDLFGFLGRRGRIYFEDMRSDEPFSKIVKTTFHSKIDRERGAVTDSMNVEEVQEGAVFRGRIRIVDPKPSDFEMLCAGIQAVNEFGLGSWVRRGRGNVELKIVKSEKRKWSDFSQKAKTEAQNLFK